MLPSFVIIGAQKAASTFVQTCLDEHPQVYLVPHEVPFFESPDYERGALNDLERLFDDAGPCTQRGIKRPNYLGKPEVPARIAQHLPEARLIAVLRNPIERLLAAYYHYVNYGFIPAVAPHRGIPRILSGRYDTTHARAREIVSFGRYGQHLRDYLDYFPREHLLVLLFDDIKRAAREQVWRTYRFLGIDERHEPARLDARPQKVVYSLARLRWLRQRNRLLYTYNADRTRLEERSCSRLERRLVRGIEQVDRRVLAPLLGNRRPRIDQRLWRQLAEVYAEDVALLGRLLDVDCRHWLESPA